MPDALAKVRSSGRKYAQRKAARDAALKELLDAVVAAHADGHDVKKLAGIAGVSRQTIHDHMRKPAPTADSPVAETGAVDEELQARADVARADALAPL
jgi:transcriptional regulator GlxA family with amidase domain